MDQEQIMAGIFLKFIDLYREIHDHALTSPDRCWHLWRVARDCVDVPGAMVECGTYRGGSAKFIYKCLFHDAKKMYVFDTFEGIPGSQRLDGEHEAGNFTSNEQQVRTYLSDCEHLKVIKGLVPEILYQTIADETFSFVYLDMDLYKPTLEALGFFWSRLSPGGAIVMDDVDTLGGVTQAILEFRGMNPRAEYYRSTLDQSVLIKTGE